MMLPDDEVALEPTRLQNLSSLMTLKSRWMILWSMILWKSLSSAAFEWVPGEYDVSRFLRDLDEEDAG